MRLYSFGEVKMPRRQTGRLFIYAFLLYCVSLYGCTSAEKAKSTEKIGMHIDAELEFVVEYPLSWDKERRLTYGSKTGEIRWTSPTHPDTLLQIKVFEQGHAELTTDRQIDQALHEYIGLKVASKEAITLPAGNAWKITGHTVRKEVDIYLFLRDDRSYLIALTAPPEKRDEIKEVMERITNSFQIVPL